MTKLKKIISVIALMIAFKAYSLNLGPMLQDEVNKIKTDNGITMSETILDDDWFLIYDVM